MHAETHRRATSDEDWRDEVAAEGEPLDSCNPDIDAFVDDMREMVRTVIECTTEPLRMFAEGFPRAFAYDSKQWHGAWQDHGRRSWRHPRRFWHR